MSIPADSCLIHVVPYTRIVPVGTDRICLRKLQDETSPPAKRICIRGLALLFLSPVCVAIPRRTDPQSSSNGSRLKYKKCTRKSNVNREYKRADVFFLRQFVLQPVPQVRRPVIHLVERVFGHLRNVHPPQIERPGRHVVCRLCQLLQTGGATTICHGSHFPFASPCPTNGRANDCGSGRLVRWVCKGAFSKHLQRWLLEAFVNESGLLGCQRQQEMDHLVANFSKYEPLCCRRQPATAARFDSVNRTSKKREIRQKLSKWADCTSSGAHFAANARDSKTGLRFLGLRFH